MSSRWRRSATRLGKSLLSLLLALQATHSLLNSPSMNAYSDEGGVDYTKFGSVEEVRAAAERAIALANQAAQDALAVPVDSTPATVPVAEVNEPIVESSLALAGYESSAVAHESYVASEPPVATDEAGAVSALEMAIRFDDERSYATEPDHSDKPLLVALADRSLDAESLDDVRGGFEMAGSDLKFYFGIERAVFINGELVAHTVLNLKDLQWTAGGGGSGATQQLPASSAIGAVNVIQNGGGNSFAAQVNPNLAGTVIQNTLNDQKIQNVTTINAAVNSAQLMRSLSVQSAIQNGLVNSLRR